MEERMLKSAAEGDVDALYSILAEDPCVLERIDQKTIADTPLHVAVSDEKIHFAKEIVNIKPSFAWKRNHLGRSPIHLALEKGHRELVVWFMTIDSELVRVKAKGMVTPLHYAAEIDDDFNLANFLYVCPSSIKDLTVRSEIAVHIALKNRSFKAFRVLLGWPRHFGKEEILNWQDEDGNTALHIATFTNQLEVMKLLTAYVKVNTKNWRGLTVMDIFYLQKDSLDAEIGEILLRAKAKRTFEFDHGPTTALASPFYAGSTTALVDYLTEELSFREKIIKVFGVDGQSINTVPIEVRSVILVVAILTATATYQAVLSPPGGYWQDNNLPANRTVINKDNKTLFAIINGQGRSQAQAKAHAQQHAGQMNTGPYLLSFYTLNSVAFYMSVCTILTIIGGLRFSKVIGLSTALLLFAYYVAVLETFPSLDFSKEGVLWILFLLLMTVGAITTYWIPSFLFSKNKEFIYYGRWKLRVGGFE